MLYISVHFKNGNKYIAISIVVITNGIVVITVIDETILPV